MSQRYSAIQAMSDYPRIILKPGREKPLLLGHPWLFSGAIDHIDGNVQDGSLVEVATHHGKFIGVGHYGTKSIAVKILSRTPIQDLLAFWISSLENACRLRTRLGLLNNSHISAFRLVHGEGDGLPGLVVDIYNRTAVMQCHSKGMFAWRETIAAALKTVLNEKLAAVFCRSTEQVGLQTEEYLLGADANPIISEYDLRFICDWEQGQKTGFYIDQRENRQLFERYAKDRKVLDAFCYSGAFAVYAARGGATEICSVDASKRAVEAAQQNMKLNSFKTPHQGVAADCFDFLQKEAGRYDLIVLDPPAFVKHQKALSKGLRGYENINFHAIKHILSGGILFTFSCSELVPREKFRGAVSHAAARAGRRVRILHELGQAPCHPVNLFHPEGAYLKGLVLEVE